MKVDLDTHDMSYKVIEELVKTSRALDSQRGPILKKASKIITKRLEANLKRSDLGAGATNYDGTPYVHMKDDIRVSMKNDKEGNAYAVIHGGKYTGYKWHMLENGTSDTDATHFIEKSMNESADEVYELVDKAIDKLMGD